MKYLIEATGNIENLVDFEDVDIPVEINLDGERQNTSVIIRLNDKQSWWIPVCELDHLMAIIDVLFP